LAHSKKSSYQRITHGEKGDALGELAAVTAAVAEDESNMKVIDLGTTEPCADITGLPSFYQTEHYLAHTAASADADDADKEGGGRQTKSWEKQMSITAAPRLLMDAWSQTRIPAMLSLVLHELLDIQQLQERV
jgi:hypothetical protein